MANHVYFSRRVIDTVTSLPQEDRIALSNALGMEYSLGMDPTETLTPLQNILYAMIKFYVRQDASRMENDIIASASESLGPGRFAFG